MKLSTCVPWYPRARSTWFKKKKQQNIFVIFFNIFVYISHFHVAWSIIFQFIQRIIVTPNINSPRHSVMYIYPNERHDELNLFPVACLFVRLLDINQFKSSSNRISSNLDNVLRPLEIVYSHNIGSIKTELYFDTKLYVLLNI